MLFKLYGLETVIHEDLNVYFVELEICPECKTESERMYFQFRKLEELEEWRVLVHLPYAWSLNTIDAICFSTFQCIA